MATFLAGDIGGTKTLLQLDTADRVLQKSYPSAAYAGLEDIVEALMREAGIARADAACFALAGPVSGRSGKLTNLPWPDVDADALAARCNIGRVVLVNDFEAVGYGIAGLHADDLLTLQAGEPQARGMRVATGPGTGLGVVWLMPAPDGKTCAVQPSEGGHVDFAPTDELQWDLQRYLRRRHGRVSYEHIVSGPGLVAVCDFLRDSGRAVPSPSLREAVAEGDAAAAISRFARQRDEPVARMAMDIFLSVFGAFVGNLALTALPRGGIYLAGGIPAKIADELRDGPFLRAFLDKGHSAWLLETLPLHIVTHPHAGLLGARMMLR